MAKRTFTTRVKKTPMGQSALIEGVVALPKDVKTALADAKIRDIFDRLSFTHQKEYMTWIESAKKVETRHARIGKMVKMLAAK